MRLMHTRLPDFIRQVKEAAAKGEKECEVVGMENLKTAKVQTMRAGRIELAVERLAKMEDVARVELAVTPRVPETMHNAVIRAFDKDGKPVHAVLETFGILHQTDETLIHDCPDVVDQRPAISGH